jgi:hypothetical protein
MDANAYVNYLLRFNDLELLDALIVRLKVCMQKGPSVIQIAQLSVLYTYMQYLDERLRLS